MIGWRDKATRRLGAALGGIAIALQLAFASWGMWALAPAAPTDAFGGHALCLSAAGAPTQPAQPADGVPLAPHHDHSAICCLWHTLAALNPILPLAPQPIAYARVARLASGDTPFISGPPHGPAKARAPPPLA